MIRYFQFRLRTLLAAVTLICMALVVGRQWLHARRLDAMLERCGLEFVVTQVDGEQVPVSAARALVAATVGREFALRPREHTWQPFFTSFHTRDPFSDADLALVPASASLRGIELSYSILTSDGYADLARFPGLRVLIFHGCAVSPTAEGLAALPDLVELRIIDNIDRGTLEPLRNMRHLTILDLSPWTYTWGADNSLPYIHPEDLAAVGAAPNLEQLFLRANLIDDDLEYLSPSSRLKFLSLANNRLSSGALRPLGKLTALEHLKLDGIANVESELRQLAPLRHLRTLSLAKTSLHSGSLAPLALLPSLTELNLSGVTAHDGKMDDELDDLPALKRLRKLNLRGCPTIDDHALAKLSQLTWLHELAIEGMVISAWGRLDRLQAALPDTRIERVPGPAD